MSAEENNGKKEQSSPYSEQPKIGENGPSMIRRQFNRGMTYFLVVAAALLLYFAMLRISDIYEGISAIFSAVRAVIYGCAIAYLLNPLVNAFEKRLRPVIKRHTKSLKTATTSSRVLSMIGAYAIVFFVIVALLNSVIPEVYNSIRNMASTLPGQLNAFVQDLSVRLGDDSTVSTALQAVIAQGSEMLENFVRNDLLSEANALMQNVTVGVIGFFREILNVLIGVLVSFYLLMGKERFTRQTKKGIYALFNARHANLILHIAHKSHQIFSGFITGKIFDSFLIGCICFAVMSLLQMPYTMLISAFVGVCNCIPFFGPFIGAIPSAILILLVNPIQCLQFIIFVILLQQFDGNILGPRILGNSTGLPGFWVIFSILLGGGLFGFIGMILGCPTFAVLYYLVKLILDYRLESKKLPVDSTAYDPSGYVNGDGEYVHEDQATSAETQGVATSKQNQQKKRE